MRDTDNEPRVGNAVLALLLCCATLTVMAGATISPSLPGLLEHFADTPRATALVPLILTIPGLAIAVSAPLAGLIADRSDPRRVLLAGIVLYVIAGSSGLYLSDLTSIIAGRVLLGLAVGAIMTASTTLIAHFFAGPERAKILGFQAAAMGFGGVVFILTGGFLADLSWRGPFAVYLAPVILLPLIMRVIPFADRTGEVAPEPGAGDTFPVPFAAMIYALAFVSFIVFYMVPTQLPFLIKELGAAKASTTGFAIALVTLASAIASLNFGRLRTRFAPLTIATACFIAIGLTFIAISQARSVTHVFLITPFIGMAFGVLMPSLSTWLLSRIPAPMRGRANGMFTMSVFLAQFLSAFVGAALVHQGGLRMAFWPMGLVAIVSAAALAIGVLAQRKTTA